MAVSTYSKQYLLLAGALTFDAGAVFQLMWIAVIFGMQASLYQATHGWINLMKGTAVHALPEMASFIVAAAISFRVARHLITGLLCGRGPDDRLQVCDVVGPRLLS